MTLDMSKHFKVISRESSIKDEDLNEKIQREGAHMGHKCSSFVVIDEDERVWYQRHKGYSQEG